MSTHNISITARLNMRKDTAERWELFNPILNEGEPGFETDTSLIKIGDGVSTWKELPYHSGQGGDVAVDNKSIEVVSDLVQLMDFDDADTGAFPKKDENGKLSWTTDVGKVQSVTAAENSGLTVTGDTNPVLDFDDDAVFVISCGDSSTNI